MDLRDRRVLVTGADGFIGSHLVERLDREGCRIRALILYNSFNTWGWLDTLQEETLRRVEVVPGDVRDFHALCEAMKECDIVFHLAALIAIPFSYQAPESYVDTNVKGTLNVLQAARYRGLQKVLVTSTSEVYGTARYVPIDENHALQAQSPYSATKIAADRMAEAFFRCYGLPVVTVRPFNTYGPRQSARAIVPTIITQLLCGSSEIFLGNLEPTRDLLYVLDTVEGFVQIAKADRVIGEEINISTGNEISMRDLAEEIIRQINPAARIVSDHQRVRPENSEVERLLGSNEKLRSLTGWSPEYTLSRGLSQTIAWFRHQENLRKYKGWLYNV